MKFLVVSDVHIHDYTHRTPTNRGRLYQNRQVAENIIEAGKIEGCEGIIFTGDLIEKSFIRPYIQAEAKMFLDRVMSEFVGGYIIYGNHDLDTHDQNQTMYDSCLGLCLPSNLRYVDQQVMAIDNTVMAFSNWKPNFDLSWIPGKVDVLFTHATIDYNKTGLIKSQVLDQSKFDLAICGDIHFPAVSGKFVSVGIPQRCKMGDDPRCTGVVFDTVTKQWKHVNLNPHDNLLKFEYTSDMTQEGYDGTSNTWRVYQPSSVVLTGGVNTIQVPVWNEIQEIIDNVIKSAGVEEIHQDIMTTAVNMDSGDIDFKFTLIRMSCHNWRSISDLTINFRQGDKILVRGMNGSGKSSILSAIKYAFMANTSYKDFVKTGQKECWTEVEFDYQGKRNILRRGTKQWGLIVDGVEVAYKGVSDFKKDVSDRFPFTDPSYMKMFIFDEDNPRLIKSLSDEEMTNIISKFLNLDKIGLYNEIALEALKKLNDKTRDDYEELNRSSSHISEIQGRIGNIPRPSEDKETLEKRLTEAAALEAKNKEYIRYLEDSQAHSGKIVFYQTEISKLQGELEALPDQETLLKKQEELGEKLLQLKVSESQIEFKKTRILTLQGELGRVLNEGRKYQAELDSMKSAPICPVCGGAMDVEHYEKHVSEISKKLSELLEEYNSKNTEIQGLQGGIGVSHTEEIKALSRELDLIVSQLSERQTKEATLRGHQENLLQESGKNFSEIPEKVVLPPNFIETVAALQSGVNAWDILVTEEASLREWETKRAEAQARIDSKASLKEKLLEYISITGPVGKIYELIMNKLSAEFSDNVVKYDVAVFNKNRKDHLQLVPSFNHGGTWYSYQTCSSGQKTMMDINFMSKIVTGTGLLVMDEFLKSLDPENHDYCLEMLTKMPVGCMLLSSHMETLANFNNRLLQVSPDPSGDSIIEDSYDGNAIP